MSVGEGKMISGGGEVALPPIGKDMSGGGEPTDATGGVAPLVESVGIVMRGGG